MGKPVAVYDEDKHLSKLHLFPSERCNVDDARHVREIKTREEMLAAILGVSKVSHLCEHEYHDAS